ncbi:MAG TPA: phosphoribosyltransferase family protein [Anaerolineae bacterium]|nr:phosphoribosyltransferase family protein [Anaerolineae bacterium]
MRFADRVEAGRQLAAQLIDLRDDVDVIVLGIPRGGVVVGYEVALALGAPFDVALSRKLGAPDNAELAIGALAENGARVLDDFLIAQLRVPADYIERVTRQERREIERRGPLYRGRRPPLEVHDRTAVIVDDGVATGSTLTVTLRALREQGAHTLVAAAPVIAGEALERLGALADRVVYVEAPSFFASVGGFYDHFEQVSDAEVRELLADVAETRS